MAFGANHEGIRRREMTNGKLRATMCRRKMTIRKLRTARRSREMTLRKLRRAMRGPKSRSDAPRRAMDGGNAPSCLDRRPLTGPIRFLGSPEGDLRMERAILSRRKRIYGMGVAFRRTNERGGSRDDLRLVVLNRPSGHGLSSVEAAAEARVGEREGWGCGCEVEAAGAPWLDVVVAAAAHEIEA
jgi:hypothetical protein